MRRGWLTALLVGGGLLIGSAWARSSDGVEMMIRRGQYRVATQNANRALQASPDDVELHAAIGIAWSKAGYFADAAGAFKLCAGSTLYEDKGLEAHADQIRAMGDGQGAAALRLQRLLDAEISDFHAMKVWMGVVDDLRMDGDLVGAEDAAYQALSLFPRSPMALAMLADVYMDAGELDEADAALWMAAQQGDTARGFITQARRELIDKDYAAAEAVLESARKLRTPTLRLAVMRAEVKRQQGNAHGALEILERARWQLTEHPEMLAVRIMTLTDLGYPDAAEFAARAQLIYPNNPLIEEAIAYWGG